MARQIEVNLANKNRPILSISTYSGEMDCLVDTGANTPVWCADASMLKLYFPNAAKTQYITFISGYGDGAQLAEVWKIDKLTISDRNHKDEFVIHNLFIAVAPKKIFDFLMIFSATMFAKVDYSFINRSEEHSFMRIIFDRDYYSVPKVHSNTGTEIENRLYSKGVLIDFVTVLAQEDN